MYFFAAILLFQLTFADNLDDKISLFKRTENLTVLKKLIKVQVGLENRVSQLERLKPPPVEQINQLLSKRRQIRRLLLDEQGYRKYAVIPSPSKSGWDVVRLSISGNWLLKANGTTTDVPHRLQQAMRSTEDLVIKKIPYEALLPDLSLSRTKKSTERYKGVSYPVMDYFEYGHLVIKKMLKDYGIDVEIVLSPQDSREKLQKCKFVFITIPYQLLLRESYHVIRDLLRDIRSANPDAIIVAGGATATSSPVQVLALLPEINILFRGNDVRSLAPLLRRLAAQSPAQDLSEEALRQLVKTYRQGGVLLNFGNTMAGLELNKVTSATIELPPYDYDGKYSDIVSSRACPRNCSFCDLPEGRKFDHVPAGILYEWLNKRREWLLSTRSSRGHGDKAFYELDSNGIMKVSISDSNTLAGVEFLKELSDRWESDKFRLRINYVSIAALIHNPELLDYLKKMGQDKLSLGLDGVTDRALRYFDKGYTLEQAIQVMEQAKSKGFKVGYTTILSDEMISPFEYLSGIFNVHALSAKGFSPNSKNMTITRSTGSSDANAFFVRAGKRIGQKMRGKPGAEGNISTVNISPPGYLEMVKAFEEKDPWTQDVLLYPEGIPEQVFSSFAVIVPRFLKKVKPAEVWKFNPEDIRFWTLENEILFEYLQDLHPSDPLFHEKIDVFIGIIDKLYLNEDGEEYGLSMLDKALEGGKLHPDLERKILSKLCTSAAGILARMF